MRVAGRFLLAESVWMVGLLLLMIPVALLDNDLPAAAHFIRWLARAIGIAAFPAGITIAPAVFASANPSRQLVAAFVAASAVAVVVFFLIGFGIPMAGDANRALSYLWSAKDATDLAWETRNDAAWHLYHVFLAPLNTLLFAGIGVQVGFWASRLLAGNFRKALYWVIGLGLLISGAGIFDTTYETIVLHTSADADFAALYTILLPLSVCAGLALPTLAMMRQSSAPQSDK